MSPSFGIPFLVRLALRRKSRLSFLSSKSKRKSKSTVYANSEFSDSDWEFASASSATLAVPIIDKAAIDEQGLYVCWAAYAGLPPHKLSPARALRLKQRIASAVVKAGMGFVGDGQPQDPIDSALRENGALPPMQSSTLYIGTFGQIVDAFEDAGLVTSVCDVEGFPEATRLGTMFVVRPKSAGSLQLVKLTLWA